VAAERQGQTFPVIPILLPGAEPPLGFLSQHTWVDLRVRPDDPVLLTTLVRAVHGEPPGPDAQDTARQTRATICPYRGLLYFREEDASFFFGRAEAITQLVGAVEQHSLVAVVGASGSGKSSVVRAGLVPELRKSRDRVWEVVTIVPTDRPVQALAAGLMPFLEPDMSETDRLIETNKLTEALLQRTVNLRDIMERVLVKQPGTDRLLLLVDQWEELFTLCNDDQARRGFIDQVLEATAAGKLSVVLTLRGDFFDRAITAYRPLSDRVQGAQVNIGPMTREELRLAIEEPARQVGLTFEAGLVDLMLEQAGDEPGHLPLLEFVLRQLWEHRRGGELHHDAYRAIGQLEGAIAKKAESVYEKASEADRRRIQQIFLHLVRPGEGEADTRRRATVAELREGLHPLIKALADERLLVTSQLTGSTEETIEVSHEALIRHWERLKGWVDADRQFLAWQQRLLAFIKEYERSDRSAALLLRGLPLKEALDWKKKKPDNLSPGEQKFIMASWRAKQRRIVAIVVPLFLVGWIGIWLFQSGLPLEEGMLTAASKVMSIHKEPVMVPIPGGSFNQGDVEGRGKGDEKPIRKVTVPSFLLGQFEVTFEEYQRYTISMQKGLPPDENWGEGQRPVINVSWKDAKAYAKWLSEATGKPYRLPTESEWEYAARSGSKQETWAGTSAEHELENYAIYFKNAGGKTAEVGSKQSNEFGLYDLSGNVYEWVEDCWHENYEGAPTDGLAWLEAGDGDCGRRVIRGGAWFFNNPEDLRSSFRNGDTTVNRIYFIGFRLAQGTR
jgi:formylglycine-generating enzyme required for sulfatase activity/energy-coupling factor transporter ATP-binding protein EcfA2